MHIGLKIEHFNDCFMSQYSVGELLPAADGLKVTGSLAVWAEAAHNFALGEDCETLVQPEVLEVLVRHEIAGPRMGNFVGDHVGQGLVSGLKCMHISCL